FADAPANPEDVFKQSSLFGRRPLEYAASRLLRLLRPDMYEPWIDSWDLAYVGPAVVAGVPADHVRIVGLNRYVDENGSWAERPNDPRSAFKWDLYIARGDEPVPLFIRPDLSRIVSPKVWGPDRVSETEYVFTDWRFDDPGTNEQLKHAIPEGAELVDDVNFVPKFDPLLGGRPDFEVLTDLPVREHLVVPVANLLGERATVFLFCAKTRKGMPALRRFDRLSRAYADRGVEFVAVGLDPYENRDWPAFLAENEIRIPVYFDNGQSDIRSQRPDYNAFPLLTVVDTDGVTRSVVRLGFDWYDQYQPRPTEDEGFNILAQDLNELLAGNDPSSSVLTAYRKDRGRRLARAEQIRALLANGNAD
ncbi:MAG: hypothetical protein AAF907_17135, partial [Planctomycetota bacterium]